MRWMLLGKILLIRVYLQKVKGNSKISFQILQLQNWG